MTSTSHCGTDVAAEQCFGPLGAAGVEAMVYVPIDKAWLGLGLG